MIEFETKIIDVIKRTHSVKSFRLETAKDLSFKPGQFLSASIVVDNEERSKYFSFSNSPTEKGYVEFTKRITESPFSRALDRIKAGDKIKLKLPYGSFTFEGEYKKVAFLSGGIGITPLRSMSKFATDKKIDSNIILIYGNSTEVDIIFRDDFDRMVKENTSLRVVHTLTTPCAKPDMWKGRYGYIDENVIKEEIDDYMERVFFLCGPPGMVKGLVSVLKDRLRVDDEKIKTERFVGYG